MQTLDPNCRLCGAEVSYTENPKEPGKFIPINPGTTTPHTETCPALNRKKGTPAKKELGDFNAGDARKQPAQAQSPTPNTSAEPTALASPAQSKAFSVMDLAEVEKATGIPRGFIMLMGEKGKERPFVLSEGLLYKAEKKGYRSIQVEVKEIVDSGKIVGYHATASLYPKLSPDDYEVLKHLPADPGIAKLIVEEVTRPYIEYGTATLENVKMKTMHPYMKELAVTRARNRVLRLFTACGLTSVEELADAEIQEPD